LETVEIKADPDDDWQYPDLEIDKLKDPPIKAFFVVNPGNPSSKEIRQSTLDRIAGVVKNARPELIILTDDVYGTFVNGFHSLMAVVPSNTLCVYSFSKDFGCTGWRVAVVALHKDNVLDKMIATLPESDRRELIARYESISIDPASMTFIDRVVADSRSVALRHTAGLSLPQQTQMVLFALFFMLDASISYINGTKEVLNARLRDLYQSLGLPIEYDPTATNYYAIIDILNVAQRVTATSLPNISASATPRFRSSLR
jgi:aspartate 4-decarboxylase